MIRIKSSGFRRGKLGRVASYASFYLGAFFRMLTAPRPDLIVTLTTPPLLSLIGTIAKALRGSRHFIWEMDVYPDVAIDLSYFKADGWVARSTGALADWSRRHANGIIALGECMKERLLVRGSDPTRIFVADNWADGTSILPKARPFANDGRLVLLYSGNLGLAHDLDTLTGALLNLKEDTRFRFLFVGSGGRRDELASFVTTHNLQNVDLRPYVERESLGTSLASGDIGLVTQREECCGSVVPSKVYGLLAAGRPILFIGPRDATPARIIDRFRCGWHVDCGDVSGLTNVLQRLVNCPSEVALAGERAREALMEHFDLPIGVERIAVILGATGTTSRTGMFSGHSSNTLTAKTAQTGS
jgi:colanic acid biosynthesis glycosyl transferase WcaI